ncbi:hypothetical protein BASA62_004378 [Batrachochytrium salamandrivorans]|nr:hypothetical protein BASA62_004378 [Batrachochytrium salamandrivorans]
MKLAAATIFSLVAIVTYAPPAAYAENRVGMHYNEIDTPVMTHLEKRAGDQQDPPETTEDTQESVDFGHHQPVYKGLKGYKRYRKQQQHRFDYPRYRPHDNGPDSVLASKKEFDQPDTANKETNSRLDSDSGTTEEEAPHEEPETGAPVYTHDPYESVVEDAGAGPSQLPKGILKKGGGNLKHGRKVTFDLPSDENHSEDVDSEGGDSKGEQVENKDSKDDDSKNDESEDDDSEDDDSKSKGSSRSKAFARVGRSSLKRLRNRLKSFSSLIFKALPIAKINQRQAFWVQVD